MSKNSILEVEKALLAMKPEKNKHVHEWYIGGRISKYSFLNLKVSQVRNVSQKKFSFSDSETVWKDWDFIWENSNIYDVLLAAVHWASNKTFEEKWKNKKILLSWSKKADNWALADSLCSIYAEFFEVKPEEMLKVLEKWSKSKNPWLRRMSLVSLFYYSSQRHRCPGYSLVEKMVLRQLNDDHYFVQKAVGWTLRESYNVYPEKTFAFLKKYAAQTSPAAWQASTEKLSVSQKNILKKIRAAGRKLEKHSSD